MGRVGKCLNSCTGDRDILKLVQDLDEPYLDELQTDKFICCIFTRIYSPIFYSYLFLSFFRSFFLDSFYGVRAREVL